MLPDLSAGCLFSTALCADPFFPPLAGEERGASSLAPLLPIRQSLAIAPAIVDRHFDNIPPGGQRKLDTVIACDYHGAVRTLWWLRMQGL